MAGPGKGTAAEWCAIVATTLYAPTTTSGPQEAPREQRRPATSPTLIVSTPTSYSLYRQDEQPRRQQRQYAPHLGRMGEDRRPTLGSGAAKAGPERLHRGSQGPARRQGRHSCHRGGHGEALPALRRQQQQRRAWPGGVPRGSPRQPNNQQRGARSARSGRGRRTHDRRCVDSRPGGLPSGPA